MLRFLKAVFRIAGNWLVGLLVVTVIFGFLSFFFLSRHSLPPQSFAIVREVWVREGPLFGPSALPYRVRIVENSTPRAASFLAQPPPFGVVEDVFPLDSGIPMEVKVPLWTKDQISGNPNDQNLVYVADIKTTISIVDREKFAKRVDPLLIRYRLDLIGEEAEFQFMKSGSVVVPESRIDLAKEMCRSRFYSELFELLSQIGGSIENKLYFLSRTVAREGKSDSEVRIEVWKTLERYPWYRLEPDALANVLQTEREVFEKIVELLQAENRDTEKAEVLRNEIKQFFDNYVDQHPESFLKDLWDYSVEVFLTQGSIRTPEEIRALTYRFVHQNTQLLQEALQGGKEQSWSEQKYGFAFQDIEIVFEEDLATNYLQFLP
jgi:DNA-binding ferritin-like protein (Dps family)